MSRLRYNNALGLLGASLGATAGPDTINFGGVPAFATISGPSDYIPLVLEPAVGNSPSPNFEVVWVTAYTAGQTTGTIKRAQEGTASKSHSTGTLWLCGPTVDDTIAKQSSTQSFTGLTTSVETTSTMPLPGTGCVLYQFQADQPCRVRLYATHAQATADIARNQTSDPTGNHGCLLEMLIDASLVGVAFTLAPEVLIHDLDSPELATCYCNVRCDNGATLNVTLTGSVLVP